uniref:Yippee like 3 n=1 Tax=Ornithorhynchus anatinus TaxID=9258 RepID=A0A6I8NFG0_ORNAN
MTLGFRPVPPGRGEAAGETGREEERGRAVPTPARVPQALGSLCSPRSPGRVGPSPPAPTMVRISKPKTFQAYLDDCHRRYSCAHCRAHLANHDDLISKVARAKEAPGHPAGEGERPAPLGSPALRISPSSSPPLSSPVLPGQPGPGLPLQLRVSIDRALSPPPPPDTPGGPEAIVDGRPRDLAPDPASPSPPSVRPSPGPPEGSRGPATPGSRRGSATPRGLTTPRRPDRVNVGCGPAEERVLLTGLHAVADIHCENCKTTLGWKYEQAFESSQKYKEGKYIIELNHMIKDNGWD